MTRRVVDQWTHRQAIQIVAQLPDDTDAALEVLERARELLMAWDRVDEVEPKPPRPVLLRQPS